MILFPVFDQTALSVYFQEATVHRSTPNGFNVSITRHLLVKCKLILLLLPRDVVPIADDLKIGANLIANS